MISLGPVMILNTIIMPKADYSYHIGKLIVRFMMVLCNEILYAEDNVRLD